MKQRELFQRSEIKFGIQVCLTLIESCRIAKRRDKER